MSHKYDNNKQRLTGNLKIQNVYFPTFFSFVWNFRKMNTSFKVHVVNIKKKHTHTTILFDIYIGTTFDCENPIKWQRKLLDKYLGIKIVVYAGN